MKFVPPPTMIYDVSLDDVSTTSTTYKLLKANANSSDFKYKSNLDRDKIHFEEKKDCK